MKLFPGLRIPHPSSEWGYYSSAAGLLLWVYYLFQINWDNHTIPLIERIVLLAILILTPMALELGKLNDRNGTPPRLYRLAQLFQPVAGVLVLVSFLSPQGITGGIYAIPWLMETMLLFVCGFQRLAFRGLRGLQQYYVEELCIDFAFMFMLVGGIWLVITRFGIHPLDFTPTITLLTAMHFHYAGFFTLLIVGLVGRMISPTDEAIRKIYFYSVNTLLLSIPLLAIGITGIPILELISAYTLSISLFIQAGIIVLVAIPRSRTAGVKLLLGLTALSMLSGLFFACLYAMSEFTGQFYFSIPQMVVTHGMINAVGIAFCGLLAFSIVGAPRSRFTRSGIPFIPYLSPSWYIGSRFFEKQKSLSLGADCDGLIATLKYYERNGFRPDEIHPELRTFYEKSPQYELRANIVWHGFWKSVSGILQGLFTTMGQFALTPAVKNSETPIHCKITTLQPAGERRRYTPEALTKAYIRWYEIPGTRKQAPFYTAAYDSYRYEEMTYMNVTFPILGSNFSFIVRMDEMPLSHSEWQGITLTSINSFETKGDEGIYWVTPFFELRLPVTAKVRIWPNGQDLTNAGIAPDVLVPHDIALARKELAFLGKPMLTIDYRIRPKALPENRG